MRINRIKEIAVYFTQAITRLPGKNFTLGITTSGLGAPDYELMLSQHRAYVDALKSLGLKVTVLEALPDYPDAYFVEDVAVVTPEIAVITRPGAPARRGEEQAIQAALAPYRATRHIQAPGTLDGGDVLIVGKRVFIGLSGRTNADGAAQLGASLEPYGYTWTGVPVGGGLHLKSGVNAVSEDTLLITQDFQELDVFKDYDKIIVPPGEDYAANTLRVSDGLITPRGYPGVRRALSNLSLEIIELDVSEACKMDGGLTCMSLRF
jgi:dimethylargininase